MNEFLLRSRIFKKVYDALVEAGMPESRAQLRLADMVKQSREEFGHLTIEQIRKMVYGCRVCYSQDLVTEEGPVPGFSIVDDDGHVDILFIGEMPGISEQKEGRPFRGTNSEAFRDACKNNNIGSKEIPAYATNIVCCCPKVEHPKAKQIDNCTAFIDPIVFTLTPNVIVLLGSVALKHFMGKNAKMEDYEKEVLVLGAGYICVPLRHPSALHRIPDDSLRKAAFEEYINQFAGLVRINNKIKEMQKSGVKVQLSLEDDPEDMPLKFKWEEKDDDTTIQQDLPDLQEGL